MYRPIRCRDRAAIRMATALSRFPPRGRRMCDRRARRLQCGVARRVDGPGDVQPAARRHQRPGGARCAAAVDHGCGLPGARTGLDWLSGRASCEAVAGGRAARVGALLILLAGLGILVAGIARNDCSSELEACKARIDAGDVSWHHGLHDAVSGLVFLTLVVAQFVLARAFRRDPSWRDLRAVFDRQRRPDPRAARALRRRADRRRERAPPARLPGRATGLDHGSGHQAAQPRTRRRRAPGNGNLSVSRVPAARPPRHRPPSGPANCPSRWRGSRRARGRRAGRRCPPARSPCAARRAATRSRRRSPRGRR